MAPTYLILDAVKRDDAIREITALNVNEISACSTPMQHSTRVLGWKSATREPMSLDELRSLGASLGLDEAVEARKVHNEMRDQMLEVLGGDRTKTLRARAEKAAREHGPIQVASFDA